MKTWILTILAFVQLNLALAGQIALPTNVSAAKEQYLEDTRTLKLVVTVDASNKKQEDGSYNFASAIKQKIEKTGLTVITNDSLKADATLFAKCTQFHSDGYFNGGYTALQCDLRLEHYKAGLLWTTIFRNCNPWPYIWDGSYASSVKNLEEGIFDFKYLDEMVLAKLGRGDETLTSIKALKDKAWTIRMKAAGRFGKDVRALEPLIAALSDERHDVAETAAVALSQLRDKRAVKPLFDTLLNNPSRSVQIISLYAIENIGGEEARQSFREIIQDNQYKSVHDLAINGLGELKDRGSLELLKTIFLESSDKEIRSQAAWALAYIGGKEIVPFFEGVLKNQGNKGDYELAERSLKFIWGK